MSQIGQYNLLAGSPASSFITDDANSAIPNIAEEIVVHGGTNIGTTSAGNTVTINLDDNVTLTGTLNAATVRTTGTANAYLQMNGTTLSTVGTDANIDLTVTAKGTGQVIIDDLQVTTPLTVPYGGTGVNTLAAHGVLVGNDAGAVNVTGTGAVNQVLTSNGALADPTWQNNSGIDMTFDTDEGSATESGDEIDIIGDANITTSGSGDEVIIGLDNEISIDDLGAESIFVSKPDIWTLNTTSFGTTRIRKVAYDGTATWVAVGNYRKLATANDPSGVWTQQTSSFPVNYEISSVACDQADYWVAVGFNNKIATATFADPTTWTQRTGPWAPTVWINDVAFGNGYWVATASATAGATQIATATAADPTTWTLRASSMAGAVNGVFYDPISAIWVAVGDTGTIATATGADPTTWTQRGGGTDITFFDVAFGNGIWVAVGSNGDCTLGRIATAVDPTGVWTEVATPFTAGLYSVAYANGYWVVSGAKGVAGMSNDPANLWTQIASPFDDEWSFCVRHANNIWVMTNEGDMATCADPAEGLLISNRTISAEGATANLDINLTPQGTGVIAGTELTLTTPLAVPYGGTGVATLTDHGILLGSAATDITATAEPADGELLIGSATNDPVLATITAGAGIGVANAAGSITISTTGGGLPWTEVVGVAQAIAVNNGYVTNNAAQIDCTLPAVAAIGDAISVVGKGAGGWKISQNVGQSIHVVNVSTTGGVGGSLASTQQYDCVEMICTTANTEFTLLSMMGNITIV